MMEIYNEEVKDLLGKGAPAGKKHQISHDDKGCTSVTFVESIDCKRPEKVRDLLSKATRMRSVGGHLINKIPICNKPFLLVLCDVQILPETTKLMLNKLLCGIDLATYQTPLTVHIPLVTAWC